MRYRIQVNQYIVDRLDSIGVPVVKPAGGHAVFVDARAWLSHVPSLAYPGQALAVALYELGGIRSCEIGTVMFGKQPDGSEAPAAMDLVRLAIPRRTCTQSHADYVIEVCEELADTKHTLPGYKFKRQSKIIRHFSCEFEPLIN